MVQRRAAHLENVAKSIADMDVGANKLPSNCISVVSLVVALTSVPLAISRPGG